MVEGDTDTWFLIQTPKDFCIVLDTAVVSNEEVNVGDTVNFFYSKNTRLQGIVRLIDTDSEQCQQEARRLLRLQKQEMNREKSFHADRPRKEKLRVKTLWSKSKASSHSQSSQLPSKQQLKKAAKSRDKEAGRELINYVNPRSTFRVRNPISDDDDDDDQSDDFDSTLPVSEDEQTNGSSHLTILMQNTKSNGSSIDFDSMSKSKPPASSTPRDSMSRPKPPASITPRNSGSRPGGDSIIKSPSGTINSVEKSDTLKDTRKRVLIPIQNIRRPNCFDMERMYLHKCQSDLAVDVHEESGIYCSANDYALADNASSATAVARRLMDGVFTSEALLTCSVTGLPPRGKGKAAYQDGQCIRPYLCPKGVNIIVCRAIYLQKMKHFSKKKDPSQIRTAMSIRLNEIRNDAKKNTSMTDLD